MRSVKQKLSPDKTGPQTEDDRVERRRRVPGREEYLRHEGKEVGGGKTGKGGRERKKNKKKVQGKGL